MHKNAIFFEYSYALMMIFVSTILAFSLPKLIIRRLVYIHALSSLRRASPMPFSKNSTAHSCKSFAYWGGGGTYAREGFVSGSGSDSKWIFNKKVCKMQTISYIKHCIFWKKTFWFVARPYKDELMCTSSLWLFSWSYNRFALTSFAYIFLISTFFFLLFSSFFSFYLSLHFFFGFPWFF